MPEYTTTDGRVLKDGEEIAQIKERVIISASPIAPAIKGQIKKALGFDLTFSVGSIASSAEIAEAEKLPDAMPDIQPEEPEQEAIPAPAEKPKASSKDAPAQDPALGWHTPAYVEWARKNSPEVWAEMQKCHPMTYGGLQ